MREIKRKQQQKSQKAEKEKGQKKVLHVGCGKGKVHQTFQSDEWKEVRLDIDPKVKPDIVASMLDMSVVKSKEYEAVFSSHNIEHLFAHEVVTALKEFFRVLKEGGMLLITMPDLQKVAEHVAKGKLERPLYTSPAGPISAIDILYGHRGSIAKGNHFMAHKTGFSAVSLANKLIAAGFVNITIQRSDLNLWAKAFKDSKADKSNNLPRIVEPDINEEIKARDTIYKEPVIWQKVEWQNKV